MIDVVLPARDSNWCSHLGGAPLFPCRTVECSQSLHTGTSDFHQERWEMLLELGKDSGACFGVWNEGEGAESAQALLWALSSRSLTPPVVCFPVPHIPCSWLELPLWILLWIWWWCKIFGEEAEGMFCLLLDGGSVPARGRVWIGMTFKVLSNPLHAVIPLISCWASALHVRCELVMVTLSALKSQRVNFLAMFRLLPIPASWDFETAMGVSRFPRDWEWCFSN